MSVARNRCLSSRCLRAGAGSSTRLSILSLDTSKMVARLFDTPGSVRPGMPSFPPISPNPYAVFDSPANAMQCDAAFDFPADAARHDTAAPATPIVDLSSAHSLSSIQLDSDLADNSELFTGGLPGDSDFVFPTLLLQDDPFMVAPVAPVPDFSITLSHSDVTNVLSGMYRLEEEEEDQLASLPLTPQKPIGGWQTHSPPPPKHPLFDPEEGAYNFDGGDAAYESSPLSTVDEEAQTQVGGGYPRLEATTEETATYLCSHVRATEKASLSACRAVKRRAEPIGANPGPVLIQTLAAALAAPPASPPPQKKRKMSPAPAPPPQKKPAPSKAGSAPLPRPVPRRKYAGNISHVTPPSHLPTIKEVTDESGIHVVFTNSLADYGMFLTFTTLKPYARITVFTHAYLLGRKRATSVHPHEDAPQSQRVVFTADTALLTPPPFQISSPMQYCGNLQDFVATNEFQEVPLPPPPPGYVPPPTADDLEMPELQEVEQPEDDNEDDDVNPALPACGRFSTAQQHALELCFTEINEAVALCVAAAHLPASRIIHAYMCQVEGITTRKDNGWNGYQQFANSTTEHRLAERHRTEPDYTPPPSESTPPLTHEQLQLAWGKFKEAYSKEEVETLLTTVSELAKNEAEGEQSLRQRQSRFLSHVAKLRTLLNKLANRNSFEVFLLLVGPHLNEDAELGAIVTTPGLDTFVDDIQSCEEDIIAAAKLTTYQSSMRNIRIATIPNSTTLEAAINAITPKVDTDAETLPSKPKKPSKSGAAEKEKIRKDGHQVNIRSLWGQISNICQTNTGLDLFNLENNNFLCVGTAGVMAANDLIITGYPPGARLPALYPANKATGAWRVPELCVLNAAIDARDLGPLAGLRFECRPSEDVMTTVCPPPPPGASATAVTKFWRTSSGAQLLCTTSTNMSFEVAYDLRTDNPVISIGRGVLLNTSDTFRLPLPRSADPKPKPSTKAKGKGKAKPTKGQGKRKAEWSDEDDDDESDAFEDEEPTSPHPTKKPRGESCTDSAVPPPEPPLEPRTTCAPLQEGGGKATAATPAPIAPPRSQQHAAAAASKMIWDDVSDDDDVPIQAPARPLRTKPRTVNIESSDLEAGVPVQ
ncbi:hypothetical protein B0H14DRAFT_2567074 [Mycena olivaceomarginata]|nr:hypothetical protein B0H14DRAFT_2567074 [Mycena olivaceomarginata]